MKKSFRRLGASTYNDNGLQLSEASWDIRAKKYRVYNFFGALVGNVRVKLMPWFDTGFTVTFAL